MPKKIWTISTISLLGLLIAGIYLSPKIKSKKRFNKILSYNPKTYNPYDTRFFLESLEKYAGKGFKRNRTAPSPKNLKGKNTIYVICSPNFLPNNTEKREVFKFVAGGNDLLISTFSTSKNALGGLSDILTLNSERTKPNIGVNDSLSILWHSGSVFKYPGSAATSPFFLEESDSKTSPQVLTQNSRDLQPTLVVFKYGKGKIYLQLQPTVFSNYFLLHKNNSALLEALFKDLNIKNKRVIWDDFYINLKDASKRRSSANPPPKGKSFFLEILKQHPPLQWAVLTFILGLILFILNHARRSRQPINKLPDVQNTSLEFTKAIAELYWQRKDNKVIAHKIQLQLQNYLMSNYRIFPRDFSEENVEPVATKTGKSLESVIEMQKSFQELNTPDLSDQKLLEFYRLVYKFIYK